MTTHPDKTLRLIFPQWQGGNNAPYHFGAQLLAWLAPDTSGPVEHVAVTEPDDQPLELQNGIIARHALLAQLDLARQLIDRHQPDRLVVLGGDCLVDLAPFAYLNERYDGDLAVLWVDAHPDVMTPRDFQHAHAMVMGNLLGEGDKDFVEAVKRPIKPANVMYAGLQETLEVETAFIKRLRLRSAGTQALAHSSEPVLKWLEEIGARHLAIHLDLDVLDPALFRSLLFAQPGVPASDFEGVAQGKMTIEQVVRLLTDVASVVDVVGLGIAEHLPWDALALKNMLMKLPLLGDQTANL
ncbi:arginase family protein [Pseudomonas syringae]|uniref:arginase family protein n=1 Tax=Pseudomonas syringae TaxID=317 RepID=UPI0002ADBF60|nr:arginase family protein [Pseudomonas syringae]ELS43244.1 Arginase-like amidino hydrolase family protein [Pseudomonas syringae pv. syringae B64]MBI6751990.1 arginase family protein [Pseudomonas syringae]MBI6771709.1 arginase family protein [Pseudomonas syringae]MBI6775134.1 arginase family protein [Pseudomonas syringae]MBI6791463.1 arginase family protein [Pseudomonas syringae]